jgi:drug/metabolite transporter (DMT)-like permease
MAEVLALVAAFLFAVAATFQQKGALISGVTPDSLRSFAALLRSFWWLFGSIALLVGYAFQAVALDHGRLAIIQPLLVTTVVFALPLGYWFTQQDVGRREILGAAVVVGGLMLFSLFGAPSSGNDNAPGNEWAIALSVIVVLCVGLLVLARRAVGSREAALYGIVSGILFGTSACLVKPTVETLDEGITAVLSSWEFYAMAIAGIAAFALQQVSLSSGFLATSVATVSTANPIVSVLIGTLLFDERLSRPAWHIVVAFVGLGLAMLGAAIISIAREGGRRTEKPLAPEPVPAVT